MASIAGLTGIVLGSFVCLLITFSKLDLGLLRNETIILGRQFLVSQRTASILSNLVAMALTLVGPRLWLLLKAFFFWALAYYNRRSLHRAIHDRAQPNLLPVSHMVVIPDEAQHNPNHSISMTDTLETIENSHSELGAALQLINRFWKLLKAGRIELSTPGSLSRRYCQLFARPWNNFIGQPVDVLVPFILSAAFIGLFVAQSSSSVLSAGIVSDSTALSTSPRCSIERPIGFDRALAYTKLCYHAEEGADGCNIFDNQTIKYTEKANETCPFIGKACVTFDTGLIDAKFLGINAAKRYQFRRRMSCAPLIPDDRSSIRYQFPNKNGTQNRHLPMYQVRYNINGTVAMG